MVEVFRATLEEVTAADVLCHVRDMANEAAGAQKGEVLGILQDLGVIEEDGGPSRIPILEVWNKWDAVGADRRAELDPLAVGAEDIAIVSALTGEGVDDLLARLGAMLTGGARTLEFTIPASDGRRLAWLHAHGEVLGERDTGDSERLITVRLNAKELGQFESL